MFCTHKLSYYLTEKHTKHHHDLREQENKRNIFFSDKIPEIRILNLAPTYTQTEVYTRVYKFEQIEKTTGGQIKNHFMF